MLNHPKITFFIISNRPHPILNNLACQTDDINLKVQIRLPHLQPLTLERAHMYSVDKQQVSIIQVRGNGASGESNGAAITNLQRSPSVGSRPVSIALTVGHLDKPPRPDLPDHIAKSHTRTKSEGTIIDLPSPISPVHNLERSLQPVAPSSPRNQQQRPPRPQPPPPPPPASAKKSVHESTNL